MELKCTINGYHFYYGTLNAGETTEGKEIPEEAKRQMLEDHPDWFEVLAAEVVIPEAALTIETPEDKLPKLRKK